MAEMWPPQIDELPLKEVLDFLVRQRSKIDQNALLHNLGIPSEDYDRMLRGGVFPLDYAIRIANAQQPHRIEKAVVLVRHAHEAWLAGCRRERRRPSKLLVPLYGRATERIWKDCSVDWHKPFEDMTDSDEFVALPREQFGEAAALRHSIILLFAALSVWNFKDPESNKAILTALQTVRDLAAQLNDVFVEHQVIKILEDTVAPNLPMRDWFARNTCEWLKNLCKSQITVHGRGYAPDTDALERAYMYAGRAAKYVEYRDRYPGLAQDWQRLQLSLPSMAFYGAMMAMAAGRPQAFVDRFFKRHAAATEELGMRAPSKDLSTVAASGDVHWDDFLITLYLHRPLAQATFNGPPSRDPDWLRFDPEKARILAQAAITDATGRGKSSDTVVASLYLSLLEAMICEQSRKRGGGSIVWSDESRSAYIECRRETEKKFRKLRMNSKLKKIAGLELRAGIDSKKWGLAPVGRLGQVTSNS